MRSSARTGISGNYEIDSALQKRIAVGEHVGMTFRTEAFNLFNHPIFANPNGSLGSPTVNAQGQVTAWSNASKFGQITSILNTGVSGFGTPRRLQLSMRLDF